MILMLLTGVGVLDDVRDGLHKLEGAMFKIWLKSDEFEGIKNLLKD